MHVKIDIFWSDNLHTSFKGFAAPMMDDSMIHIVFSS